jgi:exosortase
MDLRVLCGSAQSKAQLPNREPGEIEQPTWTGEVTLRFLKVGRHLHWLPCLVGITRLNHLLRRYAQFNILVPLCAIALAFCYAPTLRGMFDQWSNDEDMSHGFAVPLVIAWIVWRERERWGKLPLQPCVWGFGPLAAAAGLHFVSAAGAGLFAASLAFLVSAFGVTLCLGGWARLRAWTFPLLLSAFMLPKLAIIYNQATLPLQLLASRLAAFMLTIVGIGVIREGNILDVGGHRVAVIEACNGIRYLLALAFMAVIFGYLADSKPWMRLALLATAIPTAIIANAARVASASWLPRLDSGTPHNLAGAAIFFLCLICLGAARKFYNAVYGHYHA